MPAGLTARPTMRCPKPDDVRRAVDAYNRQPGCGDADAELWTGTAVARGLILRSDNRPDMPKEVAGYVEAIRLWGEIQGVSRDDYARAAEALWSGPVRSRIRELKKSTILTAPLGVMVGLEEAVVRGMLTAGIAKKHYSWASKMLHFLLPATVPIYDSRVRAHLKTTQGIDAYRVIAQTARACVGKLVAQEAEIVGVVEPTTLLRAIDKFYWWEETQEES